jgi:hypothetical protein
MDSLIHDAINCFHQVVLVHALNAAGSVGISPGAHRKVLVDQHTHQRAIAVQHLRRIEQQHVQLPRLQTAQEGCVVFCSDPEHITIMCAALNSAAHFSWLCSRGSGDSVHMTRWDVARSVEYQMSWC